LHPLGDAGRTAEHARRGAEQSDKRQRGNDVRAGDFKRHRHAAPGIAPGAQEVREHHHLAVAGRHGVHHAENKREAECRNGGIGAIRHALDARAQPRIHRALETEEPSGELIEISHERQKCR
jgi:hypothetical protein